jgi:hypothetical protein
MRKIILQICLAVSISTMAACATIPQGPSVMVVPTPGKPFEVFKQEDASCRQWAERQIGVSPQQVANDNTATGAMVGTAAGAGLGALAGAASGHAGAGALIGGAAGMLVGASAGADSGRMYGWEAQRRYDIAYLQCMYANDNQVPGNRRMPRRGYYRINSYQPPPPAQYLRSNESIPPPPPGARPMTPPEMMENDEME